MMCRDKMLTLINTNRMVPAIGPLGLDYVAGSAKQASLDVEVLDLCFEQDPAKAIKEYFADRSPELVGLSFRNADDSFWPSADWFVPELKEPPPPPPRFGVRPSLATPAPPL